KLGRIGIDFYRKEPNTVYMILESEKIGMGPPQAVASNATLGLVAGGEDRPARVTQVVQGGPAGRAGLKAGDLIVARDNKPVTTFQDVLDKVPAHKVGDKVKVKYKRGEDTKEVEVTLEAARRAGRGGGRGGAGGGGGGRGGGGVDPN